MAISERSRSTIYQNLAELLGEEATGEMMSYFPARDVEELVTKADLALVRADLTLFKADLALVESSLRSEIVATRFEASLIEQRLRADMHRLHNRLLVEIATVVGIATTVLALLR